MLFKKKTTKDEMLAKIFGDVIKLDKSAKHPVMFVNLEGDKVITYTQGRSKFLVTIEEI